MLHTFTEPCTISIFKHVVCMFNLLVLRIDSLEIDDNHLQPLNNFIQNVEYIIHPIDINSCQLPRKLLTKMSFSENISVEQMNGMKLYALWF